VTQAIESPQEADGPGSVHGAASLGRMMLSGADLREIGARLHARATANPDDASALMDLSTVLYLKRDDETAQAVQALALEQSQVYRLLATRGRSGVRLLVVMAPGDLAANTPLDYLVLQSDIRLDMLYVAPGLPLPATLPDHDVVFVAAGEADESRAALRQIEALLRSSGRPVINPADRIARVSRDVASVILSGIAGAVMPLVVRVDAAALRGMAAGETAITALLPDGGFPIIVRPVGSHSGKGLARLDSPTAVSDYVQGMPAGDFYVSRFVDYAGPDGLYRKARVVLIEGRPFVCHLAVSDGWMVHYQTAGMEGSAAKRSEEERFMAEFETGFARRHARALEVIAERMGLEYLSVDCGETADGQLLIFEVDSNALVHALDPEDLFPYKQPVMRKVFCAFRDMLGNAAARGASWR
jgi:glutathione synthase/RimK-type ligase-like ATP-grasp enzyme